MLQIGQLLINNAKNHADRMALITPERKLTYKELNAESNCIANALKRAGIQREDRVAFLLKNSAEWVISWFACQKIGAVCVPLHVRQRAEELVECIDTAGCNTIIYHDKYEEKATYVMCACMSLQTKICVGDKQQEDVIKWETLYDAADYSEAQADISNDDPCVLLFTSGTTGLPKGVLRSQEMVALHAITLAVRNKSPQNVDVMLSTAPLYHIGGLQAMLKMLLLGGTFVSFNSIDAEKILKTIAECGVTQLQMLPPITYERLYNKYKELNVDLSSVWEVCISAGKCTIEYTDHIFEMFPNSHLRPSWGSTETCSVTCMQMTKDQLHQNSRLIKAVGTIMPFNQIKIVDENGNEVAPGQAGEALVKSPMVFDGYVHDGAAPIHESVFNSDGWYKTGDVLREDPETGYYYFLDRIKDIIKTGGESVYALEIERAIEKHPAVLECAAIGIPDVRFGEAVGVAIVLNQGCSLSGEDLEKHSAANLAGYKKPRHMAILDSMPICSTGKASKAELKEKYLNKFKPIKSDDSH